MTCDGIVHGYIDTPGLVALVPLVTEHGTMYAVFEQLALSYGTYPGYAGVWPIYRERPFIKLTSEEVGQELGGN